MNKKRKKKLGLFSVLKFSQLLLEFKQCSGSESGSTRSTCFWAPDPDPLVRDMDPDPAPDPDPSIIKQK